MHLCVPLAPARDVCSQHLPSAGMSCRPLSRATSVGTGVWWVGDSAGLATSPQTLCRETILPSSIVVSAGQSSSSFCFRILDPPGNRLETQVGFFPRWPCRPVCRAAAHCPWTPLTVSAPAGASAASSKALFLLCPPRKGRVWSGGRHSNWGAVQTSRQRQLWAVRLHVELAVTAPRKRWITFCPVPLGTRCQGLMPCVGVLVALLHYSRH